MLEMLLGSFIFAATFTTLFLYLFRSKKIEYVTAPKQRELVWGAAVIAVSLLFLIISTGALVQKPNWAVSGLSIALGVCGLGLVFSGLLSFIKKVRQEHSRLGKMEKNLGVLVDLGEKFERAKSFKEFCDLVSDTFAEREAKAALWRLTPDGKYLEPQAASGMDFNRIVSSGSILLEKSWFYQVVRSGVPLVINGDLEIYNDYYRIFEPEEHMAKAAFVPILIQGNVVGILSIFYPSDEPFLAEERVLFGYLSTFLGSAFQNLLTTGYVERREKQSRLAEKVLTFSTTLSKPERVIPELFQLASRYLSADFLVLSVLEPKGLRIRRYTMGRAGRLMADKIPYHLDGTSWLSNPVEGRVIYSRQAGFAPQGSDEKFLHSLGVKSYATITFELPGRWVAGFTLGFSSASPWGEDEEKLFALVSSGAKSFALRFREELMAEETERRLLSFVESSRSLLTSKNEKDLLEQTGFILTQELPVTFSRIWKAEGGTLETLSLSALRNFSNDLHVTGRIPTSELPWHRMALQENRVVLVNQNDPEATISEEEKEKALAPNVQVAVLIPMQVEGEQVGMISLGEMRSWERRAFSHLDIAFAKGIANQAAMALSRLGRKETQERLSRQLQALENTISRSQQTSKALELFPNLEYSINNPLTAIIGAVEVIRLKSESLPPQTARYLEMIEKQAVRIGETVRRLGDLKHSLVLSGPKEKVYSISE